MNPTTGKHSDIFCELVRKTKFQSWTFNDSTAEENGGVYMENELAKLREKLQQKQISKIVSKMLVSCPEHEDRLTEYERKALTEIAQKVIRTKEINVLDPVFKLNNSKRYSVPSANDPVGHTVKLRMVKQYPNQQIRDKPMFELESMRKSYEEMEKNMEKFYRNLSFVPEMEREHIRVGSYAVLKCINDVSNGTNKIRETYKRIKFLEPMPQKPVATYRIEFIDYFTRHCIQLDEDIATTVLVLDKQFAELPPRVCAIEMDGLKYYFRDAFIQKFFLYDSEEYIFNGIQTAEVLANGKVIIYNERFSRANSDYGVNGYIFKQVWDNLDSAGRTRLPPLGYKKDGCFVVHADTDGFICLQFDLSMTHHCAGLVSLIPDKDIAKHLGHVQLPGSDVIYMVRYTYDGCWYRAMVENLTDEILTMITRKQDHVLTVRFMDFGNTAEVKVTDLVEAATVHKLLAIIPQTYYLAHLENIWQMDDPIKYMNAFHGNSEKYVAHVVEEKTEIMPEQVILTRGDLCLNEEIVKQKMAGEILNVSYDYRAAEDRGFHLSDSLTPPVRIQANPEYRS